MPRKGLLERLADGVVIGDGGYVTIMEKRGYARIGVWTPEATVEHPEAVTQLHREFLRAGSDVLQSFTFFASDDQLQARGVKTTGAEINEAGMKLVKKVVAEGDALTGGGIARGPSYMNGVAKAAVQEEFRKQAKVFAEGGLDFLICEFFDHVEECEWAIEVCKEFDLPIAASMTVGPLGDLDNVSAADCAVRMANAGASVVGTNCYYDPATTLETLALMKEGLAKAGLLDKPTYLMAQPLGFNCPDAANTKFGYEALPEFPTALEPRLCTRWEMHKYAREAYELGVRYIGGCCGVEPHHVRAISEELQKERGGKVSEGSKKHDPWGAALANHTKPFVRTRITKDYWSNLNPSSGRPKSSALQKPDA